MVSAIHARRGRCPHRPETWRAEPAGINLPLCSRTFGPMKGIGPYAVGMILPCDQVRSNISGVPSTPGPAGPPSPSRRGQGFRRMRGGTQNPPGAAPHPSGLRPATLSQERVFPSSGPGCARSTFPEGEGDLRRGYDTGPLLLAGVIGPALSGLFLAFPRLRRNN